MRTEYLIAISKWTKFSTFKYELPNTTPYIMFEAGISKLSIKFTLGARSSYKTGSLAIFTLSVQKYIVVIFRCGI